ACNALDRGGQAAIAFVNQARPPVDLLGRFRRRLDLAPLANTVEDSLRTERSGGHRHPMVLSKSGSCHSGMCHFWYVVSFWVCVTGSQKRLARNDDIFQISGFSN